LDAATFENLSLMSMNENYFMLGTFEFVADVQIIKGKLESEGISVYLKDENILNSDPLISHAIGGVKLLVYKKDKERALEIYNEIRAYAIGNNGKPIKCPNCKAQKSEAYYERKSIFYKLFPFFEKRKYKCLNCGIITKPE
jgi:Fe-S-cluster containining protein